MASLIDRVKNILLEPKAEWPVIAVEPATTSGLFTRYVMILAALPVVAGFIKGTIIGTGIPFIGATVRVGIGIGLVGAVVQYGLSLLAVYVLSLVVDALAPSFGAQKDRMQALKTVAYTYTASWIAGLAVLLPWVGVLVGLAGGVYSVYLLYLGLPHTMRAPPERAGGYTAVIVLLGFLVGIVIGVIGGAISGAASVGAMSQGSGVEIDTGHGKINLDEGALGKLEGMAQRMEDAGKRMEDAQKSGDSAAQQAALGDALGTMFGGGEKVETLAPDRLKPFVPETLGGLPRTSFNVEKNTALGIQMSVGKGQYADATGEHSVNLEVADMGGMSGLTMLAGWAMVQTESESSDGYERSYQK
ncbi:MAG: Yip1 family protein, partial [Panacagrimonas sp.]